MTYLTGWAKGLRDVKGLNLTALGVAWNERCYNATFIKAMRRSLDAAGLEHVKTIAPDSWGGHVENRWGHGEGRRARRGH